MTNCFDMFLRGMLVDDKLLLIFFSGGGMVLDNKLL